MFPYKQGNSVFQVSPRQSFQVRTRLEKTHSPFFRYVEEYHIFKAQAFRVDVSDELTAAFIRLYLMFLLGSFCKVSKIKLLVYG